MKTLFIALVVSLLVAVCLFGTANATLRKGGVMIHHVTIPARDNKIHDFDLIPGMAKIVVQGDRSTNLDCTLVDAKGNVLLQDIRDTDYCIFTFNVVESGKVSVKIKNFGDVYNSYTIEAR